MRKKRVANKWTNEEIIRLINLSKIHSSAEIAKILGKEPYCVRYRLHKLGIKPIATITRWGTYKDMYSKYAAIKKDLQEQKYTYTDLKEKYNYSKHWIYIIVYYKIDWSDNGGIPIPPLPAKRRGKNESCQ